MVGNTSIFKPTVDDTRDYHVRGREGIHVSRTTRSIRSRNRKLGEKRGTKTTTITRKIQMNETRSRTKTTTTKKPTKPQLTKEKTSTG